MDNKPTPTPQDPNNQAPKPPEPATAPSMDDIKPAETAPAPSLEVKSEEPAQPAEDAEIASATPETAADPEPKADPQPAVTTPISETKPKKKSPLVLILIVIIIALLAVVGWLLFNRQTVAAPAKPAAATTTPTTKEDANKAAVAADPFAGWKTYSLKYEKATFKYPSTWKVADTSAANAKATGGGTDIVKLTGSNGFVATILTGGPNDFGYSTTTNTLANADKQTFLSQPAYLLAIKGNSDPAGSVAHVILTTSATDWNGGYPKTKNVVGAPYNSVPQDKIVISFDYSPALPLATVLASADYKDAKLLLASYGY